MIAHGWPEDVWFHVDNLSSAHVYLRLGENETWNAIDPALLADCAQLTKANSIEGNKKDNVTVIYTPWSNLKKDGSMATGQVGFKDHKMVKRVHVEKRENAIVNRLNKTKVEKTPDLRQEKADRESELRKKDRIAQQQRVSWHLDMLQDEPVLIPAHRRSKTSSWRRSVSRSSGRKITCMMTCIRMTTCRCQAIRIGTKISWMISCRAEGTEADRSLSKAHVRQTLTRTGSHSRQCLGGLQTGSFALRVMVESPGLVILGARYIRRYRFSYNS